MLHSVLGIPRQILVQVRRCRWVTTTQAQVQAFTPWDKPTITCTDSLATQWHILIWQMEEGLATLLMLIRIVMLVTRRMVVSSQYRSRVWLHLLSCPRTFIWLAVLWDKKEITSTRQCFRLFRRTHRWIIQVGRHKSEWFHTETSRRCSNGKSGCGGVSMKTICLVEPSISGEKTTFDTFPNRFSMARGQKYSAKIDGRRWFSIVSYDLFCSCILLEVLIRILMFSLSGNANLGASTRTSQGPLDAGRRWHNHRMRQSRQWEMVRHS